jgi:hypothetical protein
MTYPQPQSPWKMAQRIDLWRDQEIIMANTSPPHIKIRADCLVGLSIEGLQSNQGVANAVVTTEVDGT